MEAVVKPSEVKDHETLAEPTGLFMQTDTDFDVLASTILSLSWKFRLNPSVLITIKTEYKSQSKFAFHSVWLIHTSKPSAPIGVHTEQET